MLDLRSRGEAETEHSCSGTDIPRVVMERLSKCQEVGQFEAAKIFRRPLRRNNVTHGATPHYRQRRTPPPPKMKLPISPP